MNPKKWAESKIDVDWKYLGKSELQNNNNGKWEVKGESVYSLSTTLKINDLVESSPRYSQPFYSIIIYFIIVIGTHSRMYVVNCWQIF